MSRAPIRCFTCGKVINHLFPKYHRLVREEEMDEGEAATKVGCIRYCCRTNLMMTTNGSSTTQPPLTYEPGDAVRFRSADPSAPQSVRNVRAI